MFCSIRLLSISSTSSQVILFFSFTNLSNNLFSFRSDVLIPRIIYADTTVNHDDDDGDDELIDPGVNAFIDRATNDRLDGQFEDITSSTKIIQPNT